MDHKDRGHVPKQLQNVKKHIEAQWILCWATEVNRFTAILCYSSGVSLCPTSSSSQ